MHFGLYKGWAKITGQKSNYSFLRLSNRIRNVFWTKDGKQSNRWVPQHAVLPGGGKKLCCFAKSIFFNVHILQLTVHRLHLAPFIQLTRIEVVTIPLLLWIVSLSGTTATIEDKISSDNRESDRERNNRQVWIKKKCCLFSTTDSTTAGRESLDLALW